MSTCQRAVTAPRIIHAVPGRVRLQLPRGLLADPAAVATHLSQVPGIQRVQANPLTGTLLIHFDPTTVDVVTLVGGLPVVRSALQAGDAAVGAVGRRSASADAPPVPAADHARHGTAARERPDPRCGQCQGQPAAPRLATAGVLWKAAVLALSLLLAESPLSLLVAGLEFVGMLAAWVGRVPEPRPTLEPARLVARAVTVSLPGPATHGPQRPTG